MHIKRILKTILEFEEKKKKMLIGKDYYVNRNDVLDTGVVSQIENRVKDNILRNADNRISHWFHGLLVDEKAGYMFTYPPIIDVNDNEDINKRVNLVLGHNFERKLKDLCIEASNCGLAWLHYWISDKGEFKFEKVPTEQCIPLYKNTLEKSLTGLIRTYTKLEEVDSNDKLQEFTYIEYWDNKSLKTYKFKDKIGYGMNENYISVEDINHTLGRVPFIKFANNMNETSDLDKYKKQIDLYDKVMSGYANDIEDIQQIIYILENYGGEDEEFVQKLKRFKTVQLANNEVEGKGDLRTLQIDIPVEARKLILDVLKKQIYEFGQGLQQDVESVGNASGVALKFFYRKLELKSGNMETEFIEGINELVEAILRHLNIAHDKIQQTYTRNMISNDLENAQIAQQSLGVIPMKYILRNHPWIDDPEEAEQLLIEEEKKIYSSITDSEYKEMLDKGSDVDEFE